MTMPPYPVLCYSLGCGRPANFKIAARWSDGVTRELKTYYLACPECLAELLAEARRKQPLCRLVAGETLEPPAVYELSRGARDQGLVRRQDME
ncbi:MAG TPA: hypothetical protein VM533_20960 [Fimbriiglobus sp.]|jgi:hypothetical protein|nr:hypothetical protein [Fimbriiglobus sp.]